MTASKDLHGSAPDQSRVALLLIDVINDLDFPEGEQLLKHALPMARRIADLKRLARQHAVPGIYVNDNFGRWRSDFQAQVRHCLRDEVRGRPIVELLQPDEQDYFVLKPKHSGFCATPLQTLLDNLGADTLMLAGIATNICVLFTANDAYQRDYKLVVPADCSAAIRESDHQHALEQMRNVLKADVRPSTMIEWQYLVRGSTP